MSALQQYTAEVEDLFTVSCRFECPEPILLTDPARATHLYHIAQEAVSNALKHGGPEHIVVALTRDGDSGILRMEDDGTGIPDLSTSPSGTRPPHHELPGHDGRRLAGRPPPLAARHDDLLPVPDGALNGGATMPTRAPSRSNGTKRRVLVVDDHPIVRQGLALMIDQEPDLEVCAEAEEGARRSRRSRPTARTSCCSTSRCLAPTASSC